MPQQLKLFPLKPLIHGGDIDLGKRKRKRVLSTELPVHLTMKANRNFYEHRAHVWDEAERLAGHFNLALLDGAVAQDHLHLVIRFLERKHYNAFIRSLSGLLARKLGKGIWHLSPFTRVVGWGREFKTLREYIERNRLEAAGEIEYKPRKDPYKKWRTKEKSA